MKVLVKLAAAAALALATASAPAAAFTAAAVAPPWAEDVSYMRDDQPVGGTRYYCDGRAISWGETVDYDYEVWNHWYDC